MRLHLTSTLASAAALIHLVACTTEGVSSLDPLAETPGPVDPGPVDPGPGDPGPVGPEAPGSTLEARRRVLVSVADQVILPHLARFREQAGSLASAAAGLATEPTDAARLEAARGAFHEAMTTWQAIEVLQFGPAGLMSQVAGGEDIRDEVYSWPLSNRCRVDQETLQDAWRNPESLSGRAINVRGLDAMEYLLFAPVGVNACAPNSAINRDGLWAAETPGSIQARRYGYSATAASLVQAQAERLENLWLPSGGNFRSEFVQAGAGSRTYPTVQEALNALSDAMFYTEKEAKDMKLGRVIGIYECPTDTCPDAFESPFALRSGLNIDVNVITFGDIYRGAPVGGQGFGFDALLRASGQVDLADRMTELLAAAESASASAIRTRLDTDLVGSLDDLRAAWEAIRVLMELFKTQFLSVLDLERPRRAEGDND